MISTSSPISLKLILTVAFGIGSLIAWSLENLETKDHATVVNQSRDREYEQLDKRLDHIDRKIDILLERGK